LKAKKSKGKQEGKKVKEKNETREKVKIQKISLVNLHEKEKGNSSKITKM
jgi:hypothetical protein